MAVFSIEEFVAHPTLSQIDGCRKDDLCTIAEYYGISVSRSLIKKKLKAVLLQGLVERGILASQVLEESPGAIAGAMAAVPSEERQKRVVEPQPGGLTPEGEDSGDGVKPYTMPRFEPLSTSPASMTSARVKMRVARLQQETQDKKEEREFQLRRELELKKLEFESELELKKLESETAVRMRQLELQKSEADASISGRRSLSDPDNVFDVRKNVAMVPMFRETEIESYFGAFERIAIALHWPKDVWAILLQCKLTGKAQEVCAFLSTEDSLVYETVKSAILRAYELVPEAYRQRFRSLRKTVNQNFIDFAREKEILFDRWCASCKAKDFTLLRDLMLVEEFKNCVTERTVIYLNERKVTTLQQAATLAEEFALMHKSVLSKSDPPFHRGFSQRSDDARITQPRAALSGPMAERQCFFCHKPGHLIADCVSMKRKQQVPGPKPAGAAYRPTKGMGLIKTVSSDSRPGDKNIPDECFKPFIFTGSVSLTGKSEDQRSVTVLRDTGGSQSFILANVLPVSDTSACTTSTIVRGIGMGFVPAPLHYVHVTSDLVTGFFPVAVRPCFPIEGVDFIMGNDIAGGKVYPAPEVVGVPFHDSGPDDLVNHHPDVFKVSVLTRAQAKKQTQEVELSDSLLSSVLSEEVLQPGDGLVDCTSKESEELKELISVSEIPVSLTREALISAQKRDSSLSKCFAAVKGGDCKGSRKQCFSVDDGVLMRKWVSRMGTSDDSVEDWGTVQQLVVPIGCRQQVLELAHEHLWSGHLGVTKTYDRMLKHFFWPGMKADVRRFCNTCRTCQMVGKPNQVVPPAPLRPIPAVGEPFARVIVDCVGPLPKTKSGNQFLLTMMCVTTRFPEAIPLRKITAPTITKALTKFFTTFGLPKVVQTDQGTNFLSKTFQQTLQFLGISHSVSSAYHPESQGALERWHQTLKSMLRKYCHDTEKDWDEGLPFVLFAIRDATQESLGFSPAELVFGHNVRGPLKVLKERFMSDSSQETNILDFVSQCRERLHRAVLLAKEALCSSQESMKTRFERLNGSFNLVIKFWYYYPCPDLL